MTTVSNISDGLSEGAEGTPARKAHPEEVAKPRGFDRGLQVGNFKVYNYSFRKICLFQLKLESFYDLKGKMLLHFSLSTFQCYSIG